MSKGRGGPGPLAVAVAVVVTMCWLGSNIDWRHTVITTDGGLCLLITAVAVGAIVLRPRDK